jgi:hypothetical protein
LKATLAAWRNALPHLGFRAVSAVERALTLIAKLLYNPAGFTPQTRRAITTELGRRFRNIGKSDGPRRDSPR